MRMQAPCSWHPRAPEPCDNHAHLRPIATGHPRQPQGAAAHRSPCASAETGVLHLLGAGLAKGNAFRHRTNGIAAKRLPHSTLPRMFWPRPMRLPTRWPCRSFAPPGRNGGVMGAFRLRFAVPVRAFWRAALRRATGCCCDLGTDPSFGGVSGCDRAGLVPVPTSAQLTKAEVTALAEQIRPQLVIHSADVALPDGDWSPLDAASLLQMATRPANCTWDQPTALPISSSPRG